MRKIVSLTALAAALAVSSATHAIPVVYDSTGNPRFNQPSDTTPLRYNDNSFGDTTRILYDDVPVSGGTSANVASVRFDIVQKAGAPAVNVSGFWSPMEADAAHNGGAGDGPTRWARRSRSWPTLRPTTEWSPSPSPIHSTPAP